MKNSIFSALCIFFLVTALPAQSPKASTTMAVPMESLSAINEAHARQHLYFLASDSMMGRNTPSPQLEQAAEYIAAKFKEYHVEPVNGSYFHHYDLQRINLGRDNQCVLHTSSQTQILLLKDDFIPFETTGSADLTGIPLVFVGYGITAPEYHYDDYEGIDVKGKIVVALKGEPQMNNDSSIFKGLSMTRYSYLRSKKKAAIAHGAVGLILLRDPVTSSRIRPTGFAWPSLYPSISVNALPITLPDTDRENIPAIDAGELTATTLFGSVEHLKTLQLAIDSTLSPHSFLIAGATTDLKITLQVERFPVRNVMGMIRGSALPDEYVVIGGHYDHVGYSTPSANSTGNAPKKEPVDSIYNGADDNASGTTGVLLAAEAFGKSPVKPLRSILLVAFSAEEKGLYGSRAFVDNPPVPTDSMVAMLNMDMIGRNNPDSLSIGGNTRSPEMAEINAAENRQLEKPFTLAYNIEEFFMRSDQASFARKNIPVIFYYTGEHEDYHRVGDHADKINFAKLTRVATLCIRTAWQVAGLPERLHYVHQSRDE